MSLTFILALLAITALAGVAFGYFLRFMISLGQKGSVELETKKIILEAKEDAKKITEAAEAKAEETIKNVQRDVKEKEEFVKKMETRVLDRESALDKKQTDLENEVEGIKKRIEEVQQFKVKAEELKESQVRELERIARLSEDEAKRELVTRVEKRAEEDLVIRMQKLEVTGREKLETRAKEILTTIIHRLGNAVPQDVVTTTITIPNEEIKGKIIGKEGRNIKAFERATGVEVIIDDTPGTIILSSFDPIRRQVARVALENLILDGRIQPAKIEETADKARDEINRIIEGHHEAGHIWVSNGNR